LALSQFPNITSANLYGSLCSIQLLLHVCRVNFLTLVSHTDSFTQIVRLVVTNTKLFLLLFAVFKELHKICNFDFVQPIFECHHLHLKFREPSQLSSTWLTDYISINIS
jgi:hypothetical protein